MQKVTGKFFLLSLLFVSLSLIAAQAQTTSLFFEDQEVEPETIINVDLKVSSFQDMVGMQFSVNWDPQVLTYQDVENFGMNDITLENNFGLDSTVVGKLGFLWIDNNLSGVGLNDSTILFSLKFLVIGDPNSTSLVSFTGMPTAIELLDGNGEVTTDLVNGTITVMEPNSVDYNNAPDLIRNVNCYPNPFSSQSKLSFEIAKSNNLTLSIIDPKGQVVYKKQDFYSAGKHNILLSKDMFPAAGNYICELVSPDFKITQRLIHLGE